MTEQSGSMNMEKRCYEVTKHRKPLIFFSAKGFGFSPWFSHGVSKIGPAHQITLSTDLGGYRETPAEIRWIESWDKGSLQPTLVVIESELSFDDPGLAQERSSEERVSSLDKITNVQVENETQMSNSSTISQSESLSLNSYSPTDKNETKNPVTEIVASSTGKKTKQVVNNKILIVVFVAIVSIGLASGLIMLSKKYKPDIMSKGTESQK
ncbi:MAG: hypothetical protein WAW61_04990 [Methylococcaceae bacterium]